MPLQMCIRDSYLAGEPYKSGLKAQGCGKLKKAVFTMELDPDEEDETEAE